MLAKNLLPCVLLAAWAASAPAQQPRTPTPDRLEMKDGRTLKGLILRNEATSLVFQTSAGEVTIPKDEIRRIHEEAERDVYISQVTAPGKLPSWQAITHDFRDHDAIWRVQVIPSAAITRGLFRHIPYLSFNVNQRGVLNIFGRPEDPVAIQFGIYGKKGRSDKYHRMVREFLAGHLNTRQEISTLYSLSLRGDEKRVGDLAFKITTPADPESRGGWWITVYLPDRLESSRVGDWQYATMTKPADEIFTKDGSLRDDDAAGLDDWLAATVMKLPDSFPKIRGFYRDESGSFRILRITPPGTPGG